MSLLVWLVTAEQVIDRERSSFFESESRVACKKVKLCTNRSPLTRALYLLSLQEKYETAPSLSRLKTRGRGVLNKCLYWEAPPRGPTPYPFLYHFSRKRYPFRITSIDKWYPFHIPCLEICIPFKCCKCTVF